MKSFIPGLFLVAAIQLSSVALAQEVEGKKFYTGFGIEEGAGYNTCYTSYGFVRKAFWVQPTVRVYYSFRLYKGSNIQVKMPLFIGYYTFGGMTTDLVSVPEDPISKEILLFPSIEGGINPCLEIGKFQLGLLLKGQYITAVHDRTYGSPFWRNGQTMYEAELGDRYKNLAMDAGLKIKYKLSHFSIGAESWFGLTNLYKHDPYSTTTLKENNYRLLLGYEF